MDKSVFVLQPIRLPRNPPSTGSRGPRGYVIKLTGKLLTPRDTRIKNSPDGQFRQCTVASEPTGRTVCLFVFSAFLLRIAIMTQELNCIKIDLAPLTQFFQGISKGWALVPGSPLQMPPDGPSGPNTAFEAHLMMFSLMPREITPPGEDALHARRPAFTLYVAGTRFCLSYYSLWLARLLEDFEELCPSLSSLTMH
jgi:hypothetical protein